MITAGYPTNFFVMNPAVGNATVRTNGNRTKYDSLQFTFRRALSDGLALDANYVFATRDVTTLDTLRRDRTLVQSTERVPHALKTTVIYDLPFGRNRQFGTSVNPWVDGVIGGWSMNLTARVQSGTVLNFGNVRLVGMDLNELRDNFKIRIDPVTNIVYTLPQDIIDNTIKAFSVERDVVDRLRRGRTTDRPLPGAGERSGLHPAGPRRLRAA